MDWKDSYFWNATKNESKWKSTSVRNRTKVYIYPSYGHFDDIEVVKTTVQKISSNNTSIDEGTLVISSGR